MDETKLVTIVTDCARDIADQEGIELVAEPDAETALFGAKGLFDSVGLVSLVVAVEQTIEDELDVSISLVDERAMAQESSPFRTVASLAAYAAKLVAEQSA